MQKGTQFKIDSIDDLIQAYDNLYFTYPLEDEIKDFISDEKYRYISSQTKGVCLDQYHDDYKTIPNPFKQPQLTGIDKALNDLQNESKKLGFSVEVIFKGE